jgi:hypothetical protein
MQDQESRLIYLALTSARQMGELALNVAVLNAVVPGTGTVLERFSAPDLEEQVRHHQCVRAPGVPSIQPSSRRTPIQ